MVVTNARRGRDGGSTQHRQKEIGPKDSRNRRKGGAQPRGNNLVYIYHDRSLVFKKKSTLKYQQHSLKISDCRTLKTVNRDMQPES